MKPWPERFPGQAAADEAFWLGDGFVKSVDAPDTISYEGEVRSVVRDAAGQHEPEDYRVRVLYGAGYPYVPPTVTFVSPRVAEARHMARGEPCLFEPRLWGFGVAAHEFKKQILKWLRGYRTGHWDNELPVYELPAYYPGTDLTILVPDGAIESIATAKHGRFSIQRFTGSGVAALRTLNNEPVGDALIADLALSRAGVTNGRWFRITHEPNPVRTTAGLERLLATNGHSWRDSPKPWKTQLLALVFADASQGQTRFFPLSYRAQHRGELRPAVGGWALAAPQAHTVSRAEMFRRVGPVRDLAALDSTRVAVFGLGAIGSAISDLLVREGVGAFTLLDPDSLKPGNLVRHTLDLRYVGEPKATAVSQELYRINPDIEVATETSNAALSNPTTIETHLNGVNLVVSAIGDDVTENLLSEVVVTGDHDVPMIVVRTVHAGHAVRIMRIRRGVDACMECLEIHRAAKGSGWLHIPDSEYPAIYDEGCASPSSVGAGLAVRDAANQATRRIMETLGSLEALDPIVNQWVSILEPVRNGEDARLMRTGTYTFTFPPHPDCPRCG